jgi:hypothetical protein
MFSYRFQSAYSYRNIGDVVLSTRSSFHPLEMDFLKTSTGGCTSTFILVPEGISHRNTPLITGGVTDSRIREVAPSTSYSTGRLTSISMTTSELLVSVTQEVHFITSSCMELERDELASADGEVPLW